MADANSVRRQDPAPAAFRAVQADARQVFFHQGCPVCGRRLEINVELLGRRVFCQHCGGGFVAMDAAMQPVPPEWRAKDRSDKVEELLERAAFLLDQACSEVGDGG
jgi:hypothetical protein